MNDTSARVAFLGLGKMGAPMALRLAEAGHAVSGWTRSGELPLALAGSVSLCESAAEAVAGADFVVSMLATPAALDAVLDDPALRAALSKGAIFIDMGTSGTKAAERQGRIIDACGADYLDAPVSGGVGGAKNGTLSIFVGGERATYQRAEGLFSPMGRAHYLGPRGAGQTAKLANQIIVAVNIAALSEGLRFAERAGLDAGELLEALKGGFADSAVLQTHGPRMAGRDFEPGGAIAYHLKDLNFALDENPEWGAGLRHALQARDTFARLVEEGHAWKDHSGYYLAYDETPPRD